MSYQALARKYRPQTFQEIVGQQHVLRALSNALDQQRLHHAYLFSGTRGVGKTTIARILAKCLNCEAAVTSTPCGECSACTSIASGSCLDLIEVDAASRTKVEDTRELLDNVQYAPTQYRYKVYLIDEVHMLSNHSFNALLKTLEEPPAHVKFLLATTDPDKLPVTILSRCLQFNLQNMLPDAIQTQLHHVLTLEGIEYESPATRLIASAAKGSMRDALSLLDQAIAYGAGPVTADNTQQMLGTVSDSNVLALLEALAEENAPKLIAISDDLAQMGSHYTAVVERLLGTIHDIALLQKVPDAALDHTDIDQVKQMAQNFTPEDVQLYYQILLLGRRDLTLSPDPKRGFQMLLLRLLSFTPHRPDTTAIKRPANNSTTTKPTPQEHDQTDTSAQPSDAAHNERVNADDNPRALPQTNAEWIKLLHQANLTGMNFTLASHCRLHCSKEDHMQLDLEPAQAPLLNKRTQERLEETLAAYLNKPFKLTIECRNDGNTLSPAQDTIAKNAAKQQQAEQALAEDTNVQAILSTFGATLSKKSIQVKENQ